MGMGAMIFRKIPILVELPEVAEKGEPISSKLKKKIKEWNPFKNFSYERLLQKLLSKIRIWALKVDAKTFHWLQKLRQSKKKKFENDNYWEEIKRIKKENNSANLTQQ